jgi:hypothetical protein
MDNRMGVLTRDLLTTREGITRDAYRGEGMIRAPGMNGFSQNQAGWSPLDGGLGVS